MFLLDDVDVSDSEAEGSLVDIKLSVSVTNLLLVLNLVVVVVFQLAVYRRFVSVRDFNGEKRKNGGCISVGGTGRSRFIARVGGVTGTKVGWEKIVGLGSDSKKLSWGSMVGLFREL